MGVRKRWTLVGGGIAVALTLSVIAWTTQAPAAVAKLADFSVNTAPPVPGPNALSNLSDAIARVAKAVRPAVVFVTSQKKTASTTQTPQLPEPFRQFQFFFHGPNGMRQFRTPPRIEEGAGSGCLISPDGYILTTNPVVAGADKGTVQLFDQRQFHAKVVGRDPETDVAVIKIDAHDLPAVSFGNSDSAQVGDMVLAIGNPMGDLNFTVTSGIISAKGRGLPGLPNTSKWSIQDFIQTDAAINPGNSGGPLVNARGQVIGINSAIASETGSFEGYGFAIPIDLARRVADELIEHGHVTRAVLGIEIRPVDQDDADYVGLKTIHGVVVQDYSGDDSPAKQAGIKPGDVIVEFQGKPVKYVAQFQQEVAFHQPGDEVSVTVQRHGAVRHTYTVKLGEAPSSATEVASAANPGAPNAAPYTQKLGITVQPVSSGDTVQNQQVNSDRAGLMVTEVDPEGPSAQQLFAQGDQNGPDIITHVDGTRVKTVSQLNTALSSVKPGDVISLRMYNPSLHSNRVVRLRVK